MTKAITLSLLLASFPAFAATVTYNGSFSNFPGSYPRIFNSSVPQFDPALGTLTSVALDLASASSANVEFESETPAAGTVTASMFGLVKGTFSGLAVTLSLSDSLGPVAIGADDEASFPDFAGVDYHDFGPLGSADNGTDSLVAGLGAYIGLGSINLKVTDNQAWSVSGVGDGVTRVSDSQSTHDWLITYTYTPTPVPEPATWAFTTICGLGLLARRRR